MCVKVTAVYSSGRASPYNGVGQALSPTDARCTVNGMEIPIVNGIGALPMSVVWYKSGENLVQVSTKDGALKGEARVKIEAQDKDIKLQIEKPEPKPGYLWAGSVFKVRIKATANGKAVEDLMLKALDSKGVIISPQVLVTDQNGHVNCELFTPNFVCPTTPNGNGTLEGDARLSAKFFVDANGDNTATNGEPENGFDEIPITEPCPQELIPCALELCRILAEGGVIVAGPALGPTPASVSTEATRKPDKEKAERAILRDACRFLKDQVIGFINSGKWDGRFSEVVKRLEHLIKFLGPVERAKPVVDRLKCAVDLTQGNPDVNRLKLSIQEKGRRIEVPVGFKAPVEVQNVGVGKKVLARESFTRCFQPALSEVEATGPGVAQVVDPETTQLQYECTGVGNVDLAVTMAYRPATGIIIDAATTSGNNSSTVSANRVFNGAQEIAPLTFFLGESFVIIQFPPDLFFLARIPKTNVFARTDTLMIARWENAYESTAADRIARALDPLARQMREASLQLDEAIRRGNDRAAQQFRDRLGVIGGNIGIPLGQWLGAAWSVRADFLNGEDQRFFVRLERLRGPVFGLTREATIQTDQEPNPITITLRRSGDDFESRALILTSDDVDDQYVRTSTPGRGETGSDADNAREDRTYLAKISGTVTAKHDPLKLEELAKVCEKTQTIRLKIFILRKAAGRDPVVTEAIVRRDVQAANEVYAQCCIKFEADVQVVDPPATITMADGFQVQPRALVTDPMFPPVTALVARDTDQEDFKLFEALGTEDTNDIVVFYVGRILPAQQGGEYSGLDYPEAQFLGGGAAAEKKRANNVLVGDATKYTLAHEIGHLLLNISTYHLKNANLPSYNLMAFSTKEEGKVTDSKRLTEEQCRIMEKNASKFVR
jgi:predicted Zn-dependent protease with MMP-like domain